MVSEHTEEQAAYDDINVRTIAMIVGVGAVLVFVAIVAVQVIYFRYHDVEFAKKVEQVPTATADKIIAAQKDLIHTSGPGANADSGERRIPIEAAMKLVLADYRRNQAADDAPESPEPATGATDDAPAEAPRSEP